MYSTLNSKHRLPGFNTQSRTASYQRRYKNGTCSSLVWRSLVVVIGMKKTTDHAER